MAVHTDGVHLVADSEEELHAFAKKVGLKEKRYYGKPKYSRHYIITTTRMHIKVIEAGALLTSKSGTAEIARRME